MANKNLQFKRQGIINLDHGSYIFRGDTYSDIKYWAWRIEPIINIADRSQCHKWKKIPRDVTTYKPKGDVILFDLDNPPFTVSYNPFLD